MYEYLLYTSDERLLKLYTNDQIKNDVKLIKQCIRRGKKKRRIILLKTKKFVDMFLWLNDHIETSYKIKVKSFIIRTERVDYPDSSVYIKVYMIRYYLVLSFKSKEEYMYFLMIWK